ncbi:MAG: TatD family hydrolase [Deltaproteobacteria bacterium]|nr:TatD family hydrolase [Deltaproteobacteria bacterium]MBW1976869.1 TatD family hydrolase [Deltaproteobacteria bacterium]MBW2043895.1 TatD family hydrolase [Deltaproteobacteria bacterium]MBW2300068.1 TatD family hydrolase [Deltaproteobacteria bacterium]
MPDTKKSIIEIVDVHAHLCDCSFEDDMEEVLERARQAGVCAVISVGENPSDAKRNLELAAKYRMIKPAAGLYPTNPDYHEAEKVCELVRRERQELVAIGEVGLDYWKVKDDEGRAIQREIFSFFIDLAIELDLPLNVHSRSAGRYCISLLLEKGARKVLMHAFDGKASTAMRAVEAGYFFSVPPSVVRSRQKQKLVKELPLSCLLLETDSPVLGPLPGERNEPSNIIHSVKAIAEIKAVSQEKVLEAALHNSKILFGLLEDDANPAKILD